MRATRLERFVQLDVGQLGAADDALLRLGGQAVPAGHVVQVLLYQYVAAAGEVRVLVTDQGMAGDVATGRVLGAVYEADHAAHVEVAEAVDLVDHLDRCAEPAEQLGRQFEAEVHLFGADVQQQVARGGHGDPLAAADLAESVQRRRARRAEQAFPGGGAEAGHAGQVAARHALADRAHQRRDVAAQGAHGGGGFLAWRQGRDEEDRAAGDRAVDRLGYGDSLAIRV